MPKNPTVGLVTVATEGLYARFARRMMATAADHFKPSKNVALRILPGREGDWPVPTISRYHVLMEHETELDFDYIFHLDADMRFEAKVDATILGDGLTATQHPGYVNMPVDVLPFERRPQSCAHVPGGLGERYYAGGFVGGKRDAFLRLADHIANGVDRDAARGVISSWHDESHLNRWLVDNPPAVTLSPAFCHPDADEFYRTAIWPEEYPRIIVALDKTADERVGR